MQIIAVLVLGLLMALASVSRAEDPDVFDDPCEQHLLLLEDKVRNNQFHHDRLALDYERQSAGFLSETLQRLPQEGHWVDAGAGDARPQLEYLGIYQPPRRTMSRNFELRAAQTFRATAVSYRMPETKFGEWIRDHDFRGTGFKYIDGSYIENLPPGKIKPADLITDVYGPFAYTTDLTKIFETYRDLLTEEGAVIFLNSIGYNKVRVGNELVPLEDWLMQNFGHCGLERRDRIDFFRRLDEFKIAAFRWTKKGMLECGIPKLRLVDLRVAGPPYRLFEPVD